MGVVEMIVDSVPGDANVCCGRVTIADTRNAG